jgi:hypothetical protein
MRAPSGSDSGVNTRTDRRPGHDRTLVWVCGASWLVIGGLILVFSVRSLDELGLRKGLVYVSLGLIISLYGWYRLWWAGRRDVRLRPATGATASRFRDVTAPPRERSRSYAGVSTGPEPLPVSRVTSSSSPNRPNIAGVMTPATSPKRWKTQGATNAVTSSMRSSRSVRTSRTAAT